jgi:Zn-dependent protease
MKQTLRLGRVAGIPVGAHWSVAVIVVIITGMLGGRTLPAAAPRQPATMYWIVAAVTAVLFAGSLLVHEFAHAMVARRNGIRVRSITLWMLGGVAELDGDPPSPGADARIALAGPAASMAAAAVFGGAAAAIDYGQGPAVVVAAITWLAVMNGLLAVFNMLPGAPLDGGRVLRAVLWRRYRDRGRAGLAAARAGGVVGTVIAFTGVAALLALGSPDGLWLGMIGLFIINAAGAEARTAAAVNALAGLRVSDVMTPDPVIAPAAFSVAGFTGIAARCRQDVFPVADSGALAGLVFPDTLARVPPGDRTAVTLGQVAVAVPPGYLAAPDDPAGPLLLRPALHGQVAAVVLDLGRVTGLVTTDDLRAAVRRSRWRLPSAGDRSGGQASRSAGGR